MGKEYGVSERMTTKPVSTRFEERLSRYDLENPESKLDYNRRLFRVVALRYDLVTRLLSFGQDQRWKRELLRPLPTDGVTAVLDVACGTGDITESLARRFPSATITGADLDPEMLRRAAIRLARARATNVVLHEADMTSLPFADESMDLVTGGYALRNAPDLSATLADIYRVMRPGSRAAFLDFAKSPSQGAARLQLGLLSFWGRIWGAVLHGNPEVYGYIAESLRHYPDRRTLEQMLVATGFRSVRTRVLLGGLLALVRFRKPYR
jgi:demethylmenaquinone methyltransferase/2-methoxy-6-polyprenyl-1,4-benzoquinol methylase